MKTIAKFLTGLTVALLLFVGYYVWSSSLPAEVSVRVESASAYPEDFAAVQQMVQDGGWRACPRWIRFRPIMS